MATTEELDTKNLLLERARSLGDLIRGCADRVEAERRHPPELRQAMIDAGLYKMWAPKSMGGYELDIVTYFDVIAEIARHDGAVGWCLMLSSSFGIFAGYLPEHTAREIYEPDDSILCGQINAAAGKAVPTDGGYMVSGRWPFASNIFQSNWVVSGTRIYDGDSPRLGPDGQPEAIQVVTPVSDVQIHDTWHAMGVRGTASNDYSMDNVFVPQDRTFRIQNIQPADIIQPGVLYRTPRAWGFPLSMPSVGIARGAIDSFKEMAGTRRFHRSNELWRDSQVTQFLVGHAEAKLASGHHALRSALQAMWDQVSAGQPVTPDVQMRVSLASPQAVYSAVEAVDIIFSLGGGNSVYNRHPLERRFRDIHTVRQHTGFGLERMINDGKALLGLGNQFTA